MTQCAFINVSMGHSQVHSFCMNEPHSCLRSFAAWAVLMVDKPGFLFSMSVRRSCCMPSRRVGRFFASLVGVRRLGLGLLFFWGFLALCQKNVRNPNHPYFSIPPICIAVPLPFVSQYTSHLYCNALGKSWWLWTLWSPGCHPLWPQVQHS